MQTFDFTELLQQWVLQGISILSQTDLQLAIVVQKGGGTKANHSAS
jgi:hypothetical protein